MKVTLENQLFLGDKEPKTLFLDFTDRDVLNLMKQYQIYKGCDIPKETRQIFRELIERLENEK